MFGQSTHASLLQRVSDGKASSAWGEFHDRYADLIRGFARRRNLQAADCEDILQEVLMSLSKAMPTFRYDPGKGKFRSFLKTLTLHAIFKRQAQRKGEIDLDHIAEATRAASEDEEIESAWETEWRQWPGN